MTLNVENFAFFSNEKLVRMKCTLAGSVLPEKGREYCIRGMGNAIDGWYLVERAEPKRDGWDVTMRRVPTR